MLFAYMETVGCYWSMDAPDHFSESGNCASTFYYSYTFGWSMLVLLITKLVFIDSGLADLGHLLQMDVPTGPKIAVLGLCGQCVCVLYFAATKENASLPKTDFLAWLLYCAMLFTWLFAVAFGAPWRGLAEGTYRSPKAKRGATIVSRLSSMRIHSRRQTRMEGATGNVEMHEVNHEETATAVVTNPMVGVAQLAPLSHRPKKQEQDAGV